MKVVVFGAEQRVGAWVDDQVIDLNATYSVLRQVPNPPGLPPQLCDFIASGALGLECAEAAVDYALKVGEGAFIHDVTKIKLHAPWPRRRIACIASNYAGHIAGVQKNIYGKTGGIASQEHAAAEMRKVGQFGFWKVLLELAAPGDDIPFPRRTQYLDYEGEAAVIIGRAGKDIAAAEIESYVWGVTLFNDWTIRDKVQPKALQYNVNKNFDLAATMGPCILVGEDDFRNIDVETRVNGEVRQRFNTREMVFSFGEILEHLSRDFTFVPGDIISGGTGAGTAVDSTTPLPDGTRPLDLFLKPGDVVEVSSPQIGLIRNRIVAAGTADIRH
jgi:2-keto-4-pentenoate hydratase/2-oxohepta-3-ene-1,7-dioic acid hydratase in catechol pathway